MVAGVHDGLLASCHSRIVSIIISFMCGGNSFTKLTYFPNWSPLFQRIPNCGPSFSADPKNCVHGEATNHIFRSSKIYYKNVISHPLGAFELNMNRTECEPRVVCYRNIGETCQMFGDGSNCLPPLVCSCHKCREVTSDLCRETVRSPFSMPKRMKPVYPEYIY